MIFSYEVMACWHRRISSVTKAEVLLHAGQRSNFLHPDEGALVEREVGGHAGESGEGVVVDDGFEEGEGLGRALAGV